MVAFTLLRHFGLVVFIAAVFRKKVTLDDSGHILNAFLEYVHAKYVTSFSNGSNSIPIFKFLLQTN